ncbi:hypothetical protein ACWF82_31580 [Nocardia sp. NPDC055053]
MSRTAVETFVDAVLAGHALVEDIDDWVERWHESDDSDDGIMADLHTFLGMSWDEYALWVGRPEALRLIVAAHRYDKPVTDLVLSADAYALAARAESPGDAVKVLNWLVDAGRITAEQAKSI